MKRLPSILSTLLLLASVSCLREEQVRPVEPVTEPTVPIILGFDEPVTLTASTRATSGAEMGVNPSITSIHVAVFGSSGYLKDYVQATPCDVEVDENDNETAIPQSDFDTPSGYFLVRLPVNNDGKPRRIHIIANGPSSLPYDYEDKIMKELSVQDGTGAYWQRIYLPEGIEAVESSVDGKFTATARTKEAFRHIELVRNFASVVLQTSSDVTNFELLSYTLCNMPRNGRVAMFNKHVDGNEKEWISSTNPTTNTTAPYTGMLASKFSNISNGADGYYHYTDCENKDEDYLGFPLNPELNTNIPSTAEEFNAAGVAVAPGEPIYVYERAVTTENPPFILLQGRWAKSGTPDPSSPPKFYRLDLSRDMQYFPLYRNFQYEITIIGVDVDGYYTPEEASEHDSSENFSMSLETENLADVSNGLIHLYVQQSFIDWVYDDDEKDFWYKFVLESDHDNPINGDVEVSLRPGGSALKKMESGAHSGEYFWVDTDDSEGVRYVHYYLNEPTSDEPMLTSTLRLVGSKAIDGVTYKLVRNVTIRVMNPDETELRVNPGIVASMEATEDAADPNDRGEVVTLTIPLPLDLQSSMFPLNMYVYDSQEALNPLPSESMPVQVEGQSFRYLKMLNWSDYQVLVKDAEAAGKDHADLNIRMKVVKDFDTTNINVDCLYFKDEDGVNLVMDPNIWISPSRQVIAGGVETTTVKVKASGDWSLSITLPDGSASDATLSKSVGKDSDGESITVRMPQNAKSSPVEYKLTLVRASDNATRTATIIHNGTEIKLALSDGFPIPIPAGSNNNSVNVGATEGLSVSAGVDYYIRVYDDQAREHVVYSYGEASGIPAETSKLAVVFPANNSVHERTFYIRAYSYVPGIESNWLEVTQEGGDADIDVVTSNITLTQDRATVKVTTSFDTLLKVYEVNGGTETELTSVPIYNRGENTTVSNDPLKSMSAGKDLDLGVGTSNAPRILRVKLYSSDGSELLCTSTDIVQKPRFNLTADQAQLASWNTTSATFTFNSEVVGTLVLTRESGYGSQTGSITSQNPAPASTGTSGNVTVTLPANNTNKPRVYRLTATNNDYPTFAGYPLTAYDEVTQPAGTAWLEVNDSEIMLMDDDAKVTVYSGFTTWVKVFDGNTEVSRKQFSANLNGVTDYVTDLATNAGRTLTVKLYNDINGAPGDELEPIDDTTKPVTGTISQQPRIKLTTSDSSIPGNQATATVHILSDVPWTLGVTGGTGTLSQTSGSPTTTAGLDITLSDMPINYSLTDAMTYTVTATSSLPDQTVTISKRKATAVNSVTFDTTTSAPASERYSTSKKAVTKNGITVTFSSITSVGNTYMTIPNDLHITFTFDETVITAITGVSFPFNGIYEPDDSSASSGSVTHTYTSVWTGNVTDGTNGFYVSFYRNGSNMHLKSITVTCSGYKWL